MSEQFKVGDKVRFTEELYKTSPGPIWEKYRGVDLVVTKVEREYTYYNDPLRGREDFSCHGWLELVPVPAPVDLKAEKALLLSRISEIDKQIDAEAQGGGLSRLKAIVGETGYFRSGDAFFRYRESDGITEDDLVGYYHVAVYEGYEFSSSESLTDLSCPEYCSCWATDLEGWQSITMERFIRAKSDYEEIVQKVKEAMEP